MPVLEADARTAHKLVTARRNAQALDDFPGKVPTTLDDAYALQSAAIALWPDHIAGWKVGRLSSALADRFGVERFIGPVFASSVTHANTAGPSPFAMFAGGSAAFEAEFVVIMGTGSDGAINPASLHLGIEVASSPVVNLPSLGSLASIADFGNNAGEIIGANVPLGLITHPAALYCQTRVGDAPPVARTGDALPGGPLAGLAFAVEQARRIGLPLQAGQFVSTGAVTGMHAAAPGMHCCASFGDLGNIACIATAREPFS